MFLPGCMYFPGVPTARTYQPGHFGGTATFGISTFTVQDSTTYPGFSLSDGDTTQNIPASTYASNNRYTDLPLVGGSFQFSTASPRWNIGLGADLWSAAPLIPEVKYQWKSPKNADDWLSAIDVQIAPGLAFGGTLDVNAAEVLTFPLAKYWDLNTGFRIGKNFSGQTVPANGPENGPDMECTDPFPGPYTYVDAFLGTAIGAVELGATARFLVDQPYTTNGEETSSDTYAPILNFSATLHFGSYGYDDLY
jgi:hypothetical protein